MREAWSDTSAFPLDDLQLTCANREELLVRLSLGKWRGLKQFGDGPHCPFVSTSMAPLSSRLRQRVLSPARTEANSGFRNTRRPWPGVLRWRLRSSAVSAAVNPNPGLPRAAETPPPDQSHREIVSSWAATRGHMSWGTFACFVPGGERRNCHCDGVPVGAPGSGPRVAL